MHIINFIFELCDKVLPFAFGYLGVCFLLHIFPIATLLGRQWEFFRNSSFYPIFEWAFFLSLLVVVLWGYNSYVLNW